MTEQRNRLPAGWQRKYPWVVVGLLWFCGFFNYADRQSLSAVAPLLQTEFGISDPQIGVLNMAFMLVYALTSPFTGYTVDLLSRRLLIPLGLAFWSLICAATGFAGNYVHLVLLRGAEGLGESFYFPASMSILSDYHGSRTRSQHAFRAPDERVSGHGGGWYLGGSLGDQFGWRSPFWALGVAGMAYAIFLGWTLIEPRRAGVESGRALRTSVRAGVGEFDRRRGAAPRQGRADCVQPGRGLAALRFRGGELRGGDVSELAADVHLPKLQTGSQFFFTHVDLVAACEFAGCFVRGRDGRLGRQAVARRADWR